MLAVKGNSGNTQSGKQATVEEVVLLYARNWPCLLHIAADKQVSTQMLYYFVCSVFLLLFDVWMYSVNTENLDRSKQQFWPAAFREYERLERCIAKTIAEFLTSIEL